MILTNAPGSSNSETWAEACKIIRCSAVNVGDALRCGIALFIEAGKSSYSCVVLEGDARADWAYALLRGHVPVRRPPTVKLGCRWYVPTGRLRQTLKRWQRQLEARGVDRYLVYASREIKAYSEAFGMDERKFRFIPFHHTLNRSSPTIRDEGYIFAGGNYGRNYGMFFRAIDDLPYRVEVACTRPEALHGLSVPANVNVAGYSHEDYLEKMAGCRINVVPLAEGDLHSGGQQTFLNSMALGKATIVTDPAGAQDYIDHGGNGILTAAGDADALRAAIIDLMEHSGRREEMERRAVAVRETHSTDAFFQKLIRMLQEDFEIGAVDEGGGA